MSTGVDAVDIPTNTIPATVTPPADSVPQTSSNDASSSTSITTTTPAPAPAPAPAGFNPRLTKRKIENIFHSLDETLSTASEPEPVVRPAKKARHGFSGSLYSTLAKYGIRSSKDKKASSKDPASESDKEGFIAKTAPHLSSILQRAASKKRHPPSTTSTSVPPLPTGSASASSSSIGYSPSSLPSFLTRLATFKLTTYSAKPSAIDAVAAARCGWTNDGKDRLVCALCGASWVVKGREGMTRDAASTLLAKQAAHMVEMHKEGCPWKVRQCDPAIYCVPLKAPVTLTREVKVEALSLMPAMEGVKVRHPLTSTQLQNLIATVKSTQLTTPSFLEDEEVGTDKTQATEKQSPEATNEDGEVSEAATLTALFGWSLVTPNASNASQPSSPSVTRASSLAPPSLPSTPRRRVSGPFASLRSRESTPSAGPSRPSVAHLASSSISMFVGMHQQRDTTLVQCMLCQRRVGLWAFKVQAAETNGASSGSITAPSTPRRPTQKREFDILKEHRSYCPYVARSTTLPGPPRSAAMTPALPPVPQTPTSSSSMPSFNFTFGLRNAPSYPAQVPQASDKIEGWRAALTVVLRTGLSRRQRQRSMRMSSTTAIEGTNASGNPESDGMEVDDIQAMVEDVKTRGGRDLLKYVKGLFG